MKQHFYNNQQGVALVITFLVTTVMLAIVLNISVILLSELNITTHIGDAVVSLYAAESGSEKVLYIDRKQIPNNGTRGFCSVCSFCDASVCQQCKATPLDGQTGTGCDALTCGNCRITFNSAFDGKSYIIDSRVYPDQQNPGTTIIRIKSKGSYQDTARSIEITTSQ